MLIVVVPVFVPAFWFAWCYRALAGCSAPATLPSLASQCRSSGPRSFHSRSAPRLALPRSIWDRSSAMAPTPLPTIPAAAAVSEVAHRARASPTAAQATNILVVVTPGRYRAGTEPSVSAPPIKASPAGERPSPPGRHRSDDHPPPVLLKRAASRIRPRPADPGLASTRCSGARPARARGCR